MAQYFGVIGNRDHIKWHGERRPFWEFLDKQPDGWLTSIVYARNDYPPHRPRMIFDCGAWSYRDLSEPMIGKNTVTPEWVLDQYQLNAQEGDFVIAPDHMLIPNVDLDARRRFNIASAERFYEIVRDTPFVPMATVHGMNLSERIEIAQQYVAMGYNVLALGGMAARASQKSLLIAMVAEIRRAVPDVWLHVLGLSSPDYAVAWHEIGVNSFDGSSHFKQAFTGGIYFTREGSRLIKHLASRPGESIDGSIPLCNCRACYMLRGEGDGIDTRTYGSNENNMGRAAHNMNMLMAAQSTAINGQVVLIACASQKRDVASPAKDLYISELFKKSRQYAEANGDRWYILSAEHGLLNPEEVIEPYNKTLNDFTLQQRWHWAEGVSDQIDRLIPTGSNLVFLAGKHYREPLLLMLDDYYYQIPMEGLGIGEQLAWLNQTNTKQLQFDI